MENCPNCGKPLPRGKQVHDECIDEFTAYLENTQEEFREFVERETRKSILLILHHSNNILAVVDDKEMSIEQKVQALASVQKKMIEREKEYNDMMSREAYSKTDLPTPRTDTVYSMLKGSTEPLSPIGKIRTLYKQTYPEYC